MPVSKKRKKSTRGTRRSPQALSFGHIAASAIIECNDCANDWIWRAEEYLDGDDTAWHDLIEDESREALATHEAEIALLPEAEAGRRRMRMCLSLGRALADIQASRAADAAYCIDTANFEEYREALAEAAELACELDPEADLLMFANQAARGCQPTCDRAVHRAFMSATLGSEASMALVSLGSTACGQLSSAIAELLGLPKEDVLAMPQMHAMSLDIENYATLILGLANITNSWATDPSFISNAPFGWRLADGASEKPYPGLETRISVALRLPDSIFDDVDKLVSDALSGHGLALALQNGFFGTSAQIAASLATKNNQIVPDEASMLAGPDGARSYASHLYDIENDDPGERERDRWTFDFPLKLKLDDAKSISFSNITFGPAADIDALVDEDFDLDFFDNQEISKASPSEDAADARKAHAALFTKIAQAIELGYARNLGKRVELLFDYSLVLAAPTDIAVQKLGRLAFVCASDNEGFSFGEAIPCEIHDIQVLFSALVESLNDEIPDARSKYGLGPISERTRARWAQNKFAQMLYPSPRGLVPMGGVDDYLAARR